jgi:hypothetical protein
MMIIEIRYAIFLGDGGVDDDDDNDDDDNYEIYNLNYLV